MIDLKFTPKLEALLQGKNNWLEVLVSATSPVALEAATRKSLNLAIVIDGSGSMSGRALREAIRCAALIIDRLAATDRLSLITYDDTVRVLVPSGPVGDKERYRRALRLIRTGGRTALHAGWLAGAEQVAKHRAADVLSRVLLLSDGCANVGVSDVDAIARHCADFAQAGVETSTYGVGQHFNEDLMTEMARKSLGNAYYGRTAEDLIDGFQEEFDLLSALCARRLRLMLVPAPGVKVKILNRYAKDPEGRTVLPNLAHGSEAWALLRLDVPRRLAEVAYDPVALLTATLAYEDMEGNGRTATARLELAPLPAAAFEAVAPDRVVSARSAELRAAQIQDRARHAARSADWEQVERVLDELRVVSSESPWASATIAGLEEYARRRQSELFSKEAMYRSDKMRSRLASSRETGDWSAKNEAEELSFLRRKAEQGRQFDLPKDA